MTDNQTITPPIVTDLLQFQNTCNNIVTELIQCRKSAGLSQSELAEWVGSYRARVARFESSRPVNDFELLFLIAEKFGCKIQLSFVTD